MQGQAADKGLERSAVAPCITHPIFFWNFSRILPKHQGASCEYTFPGESLHACDPIVNGKPKRLGCLPSLRSVIKRHSAPQTHR